MREKKLIPRLGRVRGAPAMLRSWQRRPLAMLRSGQRHPLAMLRSGQRRPLLAATRRLHEDSGQILPLLGLVIIGLLVAGVLVFLLAFSTQLAAVAQTGADAAALAGENEVVHELETPPWVVDPTAVRNAAASAAQQDNTRLIDLQTIPGPTGEDVLVTVWSNQTLASGSVDFGKSAVAQARASTDPFSSPGAPSAVSPSQSSSDASLSSGQRFVPHGGPWGFFPSATANYSVGSEPEIAARLDALAEALHLHLVGISGYRTPAHSVEVGGSANDPHTCGAASDTPGIEAVPEATLERFGLTRPIPGDPKEADHIQLAGTNGSVCAGGTSAVNVSLGSGAAGVGSGNPNVHLVPLTGGPQGSLFAFTGSGLGPSARWAIPWAVVSCESGGQNTKPNDKTASGYYQITDGTWAGYGGYPEAYLAPKAVQDAKAHELLATRGLNPWLSSEACWGHQLGVSA
ncbi:MAG: transglycosylase family protein [Solirubrobacterales bacterium]|nr:transglycosylase family protein [Solirubrobacterales bacterium]